MRVNSAPSYLPSPDSYSGHGCAVVRASFRREKKKRRTEKGCQSAFPSSLGRLRAHRALRPGRRCWLWAASDAQGPQIRSPTRRGSCSGPPSALRRSFIHKSGASLLPSELGAVGLAGGEDDCQPALFFPPSTVHHAIHPQLSTRAAANTPEWNSSEG